MIINRTQNALSLNFIQLVNMQELTLQGNQQANKNPVNIMVNYLLNLHAA